MPDSPDEIVYRHRTYVPLVGSMFDVRRPDGGRVAVELVDATALPGRGECFSLVFRGPAETPLDQRTYEMQHRVLGDFPLFLVPLGPREDGGLAFEAVVNRLER
jgi:hypothetical protein